VNVSGPRVPGAVDPNLFSKAQGNAQGNAPPQNQSSNSAAGPEGGDKPPLGSRGTQTTSKTVGKGQGWRVDVENPNPGQRAGQIHYQSGNTKLLYDPKTNTFINASKSQNRQLLSDRQVQRAIKKGMKMLGESQ
jgi:filamentous hemagglutinin